MFSVQKNSFNTASNPYNPSISLIFVAACKTQTNIVDVLSIEVHFKEILLENNFL